MNREDFKRIKNGLFRLIVKRAWPVWGIPLVILATLAIPYLIDMWILDSMTPEWYLRVSGLVLQLLFVGIITWDVLELRKDFDLPGPAEVIKQWFMDLKGIFFPEHHSVSLSDSVTMNDLYSSKVIPSLGQKDKDILERIEILEERLKLFEEEMHEEINEVKADIRNLERALDNEKVKRKQEIKSVKKFIERISTRGFKRELVGLVWLVVGLLFSILPGEMASLISLIW